MNAFQHQPHASRVAASLTLDQRGWTGRSRAIGFEVRRWTHHVPRPAGKASRLNYREPETIDQARCEIDQARCDKIDLTEEMPCGS